MSTEDFIIRQYRNRIRTRVLSTMLVGLILSVLVFLDIQVGSSSIAFKDLVDAVLKGPAGGSSASFMCARHERTLQGESPEVRAVAPST